MLRRYDEGMGTGTTRAWAQRKCEQALGLYREEREARKLLFNFLILRTAG